MPKPNRIPPFSLPGNRHARSLYDLLIEMDKEEDMSGWSPENMNKKSDLEKLLGKKDAKTLIDYYEKLNYTE